MLDLLGRACEAESRQLARGPGGATVAGPDGQAARTDAAEETSEEPSEERLSELHGDLRRSLREHAAQDPSQAAVLGALLLHAENIWADTALGARRE
jgi:hypothetical protein